MDENGEYTGFDLELAQAVCDLEGWELVKTPIDWDSKDMELKSGSIDCIWNGFTMTPERTKKLAFTKPYMDNIQVYAVLNDSAVKTPEDLKGKKISIQEASTAETALNRDENLKKSFSEIKAYPDLTACFMDLESGRCDAVLADSVLIEYYMTKKPGQFKELEGVVSKDTFSIGIKKDNQALVDLLNDGIAKVVASGEAKKISEKSDPRQDLSPLHSKPSLHGLPHHKCDGRNEQEADHRDIAIRKVFWIKKVVGSRFRVQGSRFKVVVAASPRIYIRRCPKVVFKSPLTRVS